MERSQYRSGVSRALKKIRRTALVVTAAGWLLFMPTPSASAACTIPILCEIPIVGDVISGLDDAIKGIAYTLGDAIGADGLVGAIIKADGSGSLLSDPLRIIGSVIEGPITGVANLASGADGNVLGSILSILGDADGGSLGGDVIGGLSDLGNVTGSIINIGGADAGGPLALERVHTI